jgi:hypothetical protein
MSTIKDLTVTSEVRPCTPAEGEPAFTLLGRDPVAPHLLLIWAAVRHRFEPDHPKNIRAHEIARDMIQFKQDHPELGPNVHMEDLAHPLAEEEARVSGHTKRLIALGSLSMQDLLRQLRDLIKVAGIFDVLVPAPIAERIERAVNTLDAFEFFRHLKTRGLYARVLHGVEVQAASPINEGDKLTIYVGEGGRFWARPDDEFNDGRFKRAQPDPMTGKFPE